MLADAIANATTLVDGLTVIGGGLAGASKLFLPKTIEMMNRKFNKQNGTVPRMEIAAFNLELPHELDRFLDHKKVMINVPFSSEQIPYYPDKKTGVGISRLGTSKAVAIGAYAFAAKEVGLL